MVSSSCNMSSPLPLEGFYFSDDIETLSDLKRKMLLLGYNSSAFLELNLMTKFCSRELLLAIGWIIARCNLIDMLSASFIKFSLINCEDTSCINKEQNVKKFNDVTQTLEHVDQIIWKLRHLKFSIHSLSAIQQQRIKYLHEVNIYVYKSLICINRVVFI
ncbi:uncharacterized protein LOC111619784 [Centruroides sculpturatus]|uniref:uncharacterized protein LOC111619784 n=1 Tax=Centruroides sculpturatus TaxID=218467 RepID=UPI000C6D0033|nr:uncharacterized protein LOC111619784 [Centruroides sculpturatus]